jgi:hypothetical protein
MRQRHGVQIVVGGQDGKPAGGRRGRGTYCREGGGIVEGVDWIFTRRMLSGGIDTSRGCEWMETLSGFLLLKSLSPSAQSHRRR